MGITELTNFIYSKEKSTPSHISFRLFGIKMNFLKPSIKKERKKFAEYYQSFENASLIPPAEGNLRLIQKANSELLRVFNDICKENNIQYWIDFGTLLGAVRHKGFIPWDDDIDLGMIREDYEKLIELFQEGKINNPDLELEFENNKKNKCFVKIQHKKSENLFLDIFPYDLYHSKLSQDEKKNLSEKISNLKVSKLLDKQKHDKNMRASFKRITKEQILDNIDSNKNT